jgi:RNA polymerase sigma-70 factor (ECF subfamily)
MSNMASHRSELVGGATSASVGVPADLRQLIADYYRDVYRYAYRLSGNQADAEDLTQQTFLVAQSKLHQLREPEKANRWLFAVLRSCFLKSVGRANPLPIDPHDLLVEDTEAAWYSSHVIDQEELQVALNGLPDVYRCVLLMFYFDELSYQEIADQIGIPIGTVMSRLARAKLRLRERLTEQSAEQRPARGGRCAVRLQ